MSRLFAVLVLSCVLAAPARAVLSHRAPPLPAPVPGEIVVLLPREAAFARGAQGEALVPDAARATLFARLGLAPVRALGGAAGRGLGGRAALVRGHGPGFDAAAACAELRASGLVRAAVPNVRVRLHSTIPNDPWLPSQWSVDTPAGTHVRLPQAWDLSQGDTSVVIAIMDTGVDTGHPDLAEQIWTNREEIAGNAVDDDANGYVDDLHGWDFGDGDNDPNPTALIDEIGLDEGFHGTFCAGIASAATGNAIGIAGAGWRCRILPLRIFDSAGGATTAGIADAFDYAIGAGASVLSMSFGSPDQPGLPEFFQALVDDALAAGVVCVASAGNDGTDTPLIYPAACDGMISVAATTEDDLRAEFSNWGPTVDLAAPGQTVFSTICRNYEIDELSQIFYLYFFGWDGENPYMFGDGTSFATPLVAGICGLLRAHEPGLTPAAVRARLLATGDAVAYDLPIGPRVNAYQALLGGVLDASPALVPTAVRLAAPVPNPSSGDATLAFALPAAGAVELAMFDAAGRRVRTVAAGAFAAGGHAARWDGRDEQGTPVRPGLYFARLVTPAGRATARVVRLDS